MSHEKSLRRRVGDALAGTEMFASGVPEFEVEELATLPHTQVARVRITDAESPLASLIYKCSRQGFVYLTAREVRFYRAMAREWAPALIPRCHLALEDNDAATLLLDDIATTHEPCGGASPTLDQAVAFVEALGRMHGDGLRRPELADRHESMVQDGPNNTIAGRLALLPTLLPRFLESNGSAVSATCRRLLLRVAESAEVHASYFGERAILHGDAHYWNALYGAGGAVLLDWGSTCLGPGEIDVAHAVALNLPCELRREWEDALLAVYDGALRDVGISRRIGETRERYRLGVLYAVTVPVRQWSGGVPQQIWQRLLENATAAAADLDVDSLL